MAKFLSDEWFGGVHALRDGLGVIDVPEAYRGLTINLSIEQADGSTQPVNLQEGRFDRGLVEGAQVSISVPVDVAKKVFVQLDHQAGTKAYLAGQLKIDGDLSRLAALQSSEPTPTLRALHQGIQALTD